MYSTLPRNATGDLYRLSGVFEIENVTGSAITGKTNDGLFDIQAVIGRRPMPAGIQGGRISLLRVYDSAGPVVHYNGGWMVLPKPGLHRDLLDSIVKAVT